MPVPIPFPREPIPVPGPEEAPSRVFTSPDGTRAVWVRGWDYDAYLYDLTEPPAFPAKWLEWNVRDVGFWMDENTGQLLDIELRRYDDESSWFDPDGNPIGPDSATPADMKTIAPQLQQTHLQLDGFTAEGLGGMLR
ncbi:MAG: hypothetical protein HY078_02345 [Elusimicrobia bacterium]|nr:hypothetical protein [Elusimicrobiota bacterium]